MSRLTQTTGRQRNRANPYKKIGDRYQGLLADYTVLPVPRSLVERVKGPFGEKRRSISGIVIDTDQFKQTKTLQEDELHIYDAYRADLQTQEEFTPE